MANSRDFTGKNRKFTGTKGIVTPKGTTGQRVGAESGELRFNTTTELMEYYDGNQWKPIDAPPSISSISTDDATGTNLVLNADGSTLFTITIAGGNFGVGATVKFIGNTGTEYVAGNTTRVSNSSITCKTTSSMGTTDDPYDVQVTNNSGLAATLEDAFSFNAPPVFTRASGQIGTVYDGQVISGTTLNAGATDAEGNTITHTIISGSLPGSGLSFSSSTGAITGTLSGTPSLGNYPFVVRAATTEGTVERQFSIQVIAIPSVEMSFLVIGGGGAGQRNYGGGGGAGGFRTSTQSNQINRTITVTVGDGGAAQALTPYTVETSNSGTASSISGTGLTTISSAGGGGGSQAAVAGSGGSGGGAGDTTGTAGSGNTPNTSPSQGNNGGIATGSAPHYGAGAGGGAGAVGGNGSNTVGGTGGAGTANSITGSSVTRAGGGGGGTHSNGPNGSGGAGGGGAGGQPGVAGTANTGGGGGGGADDGDYSFATGGAGGKGVVIISVPTTSYSGTTTGSPTVTTSGSNTILTFTGSGSYTI
jgi:hypothetical protein